MIAERSIVWMLLNCHQLKAVISSLDNTREYLILELCICADLLLVLRHTDMCLIYKQRSGIRLERFLLPYIFLFRSPHLCREYLCLCILYHATAPCRNTLSLTTIPMHGHLIQLSMRQCLGRKLQFPVSGILHTLGSKLCIFLPTVEITYNIYGCSIRCPLSKYPLALVVTMQTIVFMTVCEIRQRHLTLISKLFLHPNSMIMTSTDSILVRLKPRIVGHNADMFWNSCLSGCFLCFCHKKYVFLGGNGILRLHLEDSLPELWNVGNARSMTVLREEDNHHARTACDIA